MFVAGEIQKYNHSKERQETTIYSYKGKLEYLMFSDGVTARTTTKAFWMEKGPHASKIIAIPNFTIASAA